MLHNYYFDDYDDKISNEMGNFTFFFLSYFLPQNSYYGKFVSCRFSSSSFFCDRKPKQSFGFYLQQIDV